MLQIEPFLYDSYYKICTDRNPYLATYRIVAGAVEIFDSKMLFYPFEDLMRSFS